MTCLPMRLEADGLETLVFDTDGIESSTIDLGDAETRVVSEAAADADGTIDSTELIGARAVTLKVLIDSTASASTRFALTNRLRAFTHPRLRPRLYMQLSDTDPELVVTLRRGPFSDLWTPQTRQRNKVTVQWIAPLGIIESAVEHSGVANAAGDGEVGRTYDLAYDRTYPASDPLGSLTIANDGTADAYPLLRMYGPCTGPKIENTTTDRAIVFKDSLSIVAGSFVEIDTRAKTLRINGDPASSAQNELLFPDTRWWTLVPGVNELRFFPTTYSPPSQTQVVWRDAYL